MDMNRLFREDLVSMGLKHYKSLRYKLRELTYPKVAPEPSMYFPRVRMTPLGPAPYWKIVTVPAWGKILKKTYVGFVSVTNRQ
jgi:hypothetical protein